MLIGRDGIYDFNYSCVFGDKSDNLTLYSPYTNIALQINKNCGKIFGITNHKNSDIINKSMRPILYNSKKKLYIKIIKDLDNFVDTYPEINIVENYRCIVNYFWKMKQNMIDIINNVIVIKTKNFSNNILDTVTPKFNIYMKVVDKINKANIFNVCKKIINSCINYKCYLSDIKK
jgi:hypothetical protein